MTIRAMDSLLSHFPKRCQELAAKTLPHSLFLQKYLDKRPDWIETVIAPPASNNNQLRLDAAEQLLNSQNENELLSAIRQIRHREMCRIAWQDLTQAVSLQRTLLDTSELADMLIQNSYLWWYDHFSKLHGSPLNADGGLQHMIILGMGKLGGNELNFSSDIDLIFAFPDKGETDGKRPIDNQQFFTKVGQKLINSLSKTTADGQAYRVDMRLRPFGQSGALVLSFDAMEHYYQTHGREWERYALIKARSITLTEGAGQELFERLNPFIYRRYMDYGSITNLRQMKESIERESRHKNLENNVKLGRGGIREIEFMAQLFQLIRGGRERRLQGQQLLPMLDNLQELGLIDEDENSTLKTAYHLLRQIENRLQMWNDEQTHALPQEPERLALLADNLGYENLEAFQATLQQHRQQVSELFDQLFYRDDEDEGADTTSSNAWVDFDEESLYNWLSARKFQQAGEHLKELADLRQGRLYKSLSKLGRERLGKLIPLLLQTAAERTHPDIALERSLVLIRKIASRSGYIALLGENAAALKLLVRLIRNSSWIANEIGQSPMLLDELLDIRQLYRPLDKPQLQQELHYQLEQADRDDTEQIMERLRDFKRSQVLRVAATDIMDELPLMKVSDQLTWIAESILEHTLQYAWQELIEKHGKPCYQLEDGARHEASFAIVAYGKMGGLELGYGSDLDIIFLHDSHGKKQLTDGDKQLDNSVFFTRLAQRIIFILNTFTMGGRLYEIDTRLRPSGASGMMVSQIESFHKYQLEKAWTWEHQAITRARAVAGSDSMIKRFDEIRLDVISRAADKPELCNDIRKMREKMWTQFPVKKGEFNLKKHPGGITDLEFIVQYLVLLHTAAYPDLSEFSDNIRMLEALARNDILDQQTAEQLIEAYKLMRDRIHERVLQDQSAVVADDEYTEQRQLIQSTWQAHFFGC